MQHSILVENTDNCYKTAILVKPGSFNKHDLQTHYTSPDSPPTIAFTLDYNDQDKCPVSLIKNYLKSFEKIAISFGIEVLLVADSTYFKAITKCKTVAPNQATVLYWVQQPKIKAIYIPDFRKLFYNPHLNADIQLALDTLKNYYSGLYFPLGTDVIHNSYYPNTVNEILDAIYNLHDHPELTCDIETHSLEFNKAGIVSIAFAWNKHEGIAFNVNGLLIIRTALKNFFRTYKGTLIYHGGSYDIKILIYELFMKDISDIQGLLCGLDAMYKNMHDTLVITYLATNTCSGNELSLKKTAFKFLGNYAEEDIKNISKIPRLKLLEYNLKDCLGTWYTFDTYFPIMAKEAQMELYKDIFLPSMKVLTQTELTGMCLDMIKVKEAETSLLKIKNKYEDILISSKDIQKFELSLQEQAMQDANAKLKKKVKPITDFKDIRFNPNSGKQVGKLLHAYFNLPILSTTDTGLPSTSTDALKEHLTKKTNINLILESLIELNQVNKILDTFIHAFLNKSIKHPDGYYYLHGNFNLCGARSHRMSSSKINLQQLPSTGSKYASIIKRCFIAPPGMIMVGADFDQLEDIISALTTKDPNKLMVYTDGFDVHCLNSYFYFKDQMPDITKELEGYFEPYKETD